MNNPKDEFYRTLNEIVGAERLSNEETYIINDYVSRLEATHREEQKETERLNNIINELEKDIQNEIDRTNQLMIEDSSLVEINNIKKMLNEERQNILLKINCLKGVNIRYESN